MKHHHILTRKKIGEILIRQGRVTQEQLTQFLKIQKETGKILGQILIEEKILNADELNRILAEQLGIPHVHMRKGLIDPNIVGILPKDKALQYKVIPMFLVKNVLTLATSEPHNFFVFDEVAKITNTEVQPVSCRVENIIEAIKECYKEQVNIDDVMTGMGETGIEIVQSTQEKTISEISEMAEGSPVINLTNSILLKAIRDGASDIHLEPQAGSFRIRIRIDGLLYELMSPKIEFHPAVVSRLKVMAQLDIAERRIPQDGRMQVLVDDRTIDLRFSSMPSIHGEKVVLRILDQRKAILDINSLGFDPLIVERFKAHLKRPYGLILVCGPTGSGKTTTLYSAITLLNTPEKNIVTIEDPVEYQLKGITQNQVKASIGLTFAKFLKHTLRQDPDIILVGEIRDRETAEIAIQASLTGHLVLSTLHTNDGISAITRLLEMGIESYLISSSLIATLAQRLARTICPECKTDYYPPKSIIRELGIEETQQIRLVKGRGCAACYDSGYKGRTGIHEILEMDEGLKALIMENPTSDNLLKYMKGMGHRTLREIGYDKVLSGITTIEEIQRVTSIDR